MIRPPWGVWSFMIRKAACVHRNGPVRLMSTTFFHCSKVRSSSITPGALTPALLNSTSTRPQVAFTFANSAATDSGWLTSVGTAIARPGAAPDSVIASANGSARRPASATR